MEFDDFGNPHSSDYLFMDGPAILNYSIESIPSLVADVLEKNNLKMEDIDLHVYHQANKFLADLERRISVLEIERNLKKNADSKSCRRLDRALSSANAEKEKDKSE